MAKQSINIVERHVEKGVLGICGLVLIGAIALYLVSTPNTVDIKGQQATPENIDQIVLNEAQSLLTKMRGAKVETVEVEPFLEQFTASNSPIDYAGIEVVTRSPAPWLPPVPDVKWTPVAGELRLADVIAVEDIKVTFGRSTIEPVPPQILGKGDPNIPSGFPSDVNWVTVAAKFDQVRQITAAKNAGYKAGKRNPYIHGVDLQRREKLSDGSYGEWVNVIPYRPLVSPQPPKIVIEQTRKGPLPTPETQENVRDFFTLIREGQVELLRPIFPSAIYGDMWAMPTYADLSIAELDLELCPGEACERRDYGIPEDIDPTAEAEKTDREIIAEQLRAARAALAMRKWSESQSLANTAKNHPAATTKDKQESQQISDKARQGKINEDAGRLKPLDPESAEGGDELDRPRSRYQVIWAHDASTAVNGGVESGKTYQYRMRLRLFNRYAAQPQDLSEASEAEKIELVGPWSAPSEDVYIPQDTVFFLTSGNPSSGVSPKVTVFKWFEGVWTKDTFSVDVGERIQKESQHAVRVLTDGTVDRPSVNFDAGATVIDIVEDYQFPTKKERGKTFSFEPVEPTIALVYVDHATGELGRRVLAIDRKSSALKEFKSIVFEAPRR